MGLNAGLLPASAGRRPPAFSPAPGLASAPARLQALIGRCFKHDPGERPTAEEVLAELQEMLRQPQYRAAANGSAAVGPGGPPAAEQDGGYGPDYMDD